MIAEVRAGASMRAVARAHRVSLSTVQWWCRRAGDLSLDRVDWSDRSPIPRTVHRTESAVEDLVVSVRRELKETSDLGEYGARALHRALMARGQALVPSVRTIGRILERRGALDAGRRIRRLLRLKVGTSPSWRQVGPNSTASTLSRGWHSKGASASRSSTSFPCRAGCLVLGRSHSLRREPRWRHSWSTGRSLGGRPTRSST